MTKIWRPPPASRKYRTSQCHATKWGFSGFPCQMWRNHNLLKMQQSSTFRRKPPSGCHSSLQHHYQCLQKKYVYSFISLLVTEFWTNKLLMSALFSKAVKTVLYTQFSSKIHVQVNKWLLICPENNLKISAKSRRYFIIIHVWPQRLVVKFNQIWIDIW